MAIPQAPVKIAITGRFRRGKDTLAAMLQTLLITPTTQLRFADALKTELAEMTLNYMKPPEYVTVVEDGNMPMVAVVPGGHKAWNEYMRERRDINGLGWQWWGEFRRQTCGEDYWVKHPLFRQRYGEALLNIHNIIIADMRHHVEVDWCKRNGFHLIRIEGPCRTEGEARDPNHASERYIDVLEVDAVVSNESSLTNLNTLARAVLMNASEHAR